MVKQAENLQRISVYSLIVDNIQLCTILVPILPERMVPMEGAAERVCITLEFSATLARVCGTGELVLEVSSDGKLACAEIRKVMEGFGTGLLYTLVCGGRLLSEVDSVPAGAVVAVLPVVLGG
jgi:hypothetical protein